MEEGTKTTWLSQLMQKKKFDKIQQLFMIKTLKKLEIENFKLRNLKTQS